MKKLVLSIAVVVTFAAYSMVLRHQHSEAVIAPASLSQTKSASAATTDTNSSSTNTTSTPITPTTTTSTYKDGTYTGSVENAYYGNVQVSAIIQNGKLATVNFLEYPNENPNSQYVNQQAIPYLKQEAVQAQSAHVSVITGATFTSQAFTQSLAAALDQAKQS